MTALITRGFLGSLVITEGFGARIPVGTGTDVLGSLQSWWQVTSEVQALTSDGKLWFKQAPEETLLPYATYFLVSEPDETWTTAYVLQRATVQVNFHTATAAQARGIVKQFRLAVKQAPLTIGGDPVMHVLYDGGGIALGEGLGPNGADCWMAYETLDIPWTRMMGITDPGIFDAHDILAAVAAWLGGSTTLDPTIASWPYYYDETPEPQPPFMPFITILLDDEPIEVWTTGYPLYRSVISFKIHAPSAAIARSAAITFREDFEQEVISIDGRPVMHVLGASDAIELGEGLGPNGADMWTATETFEISWTE